MRHVVFDAVSAWHCFQLSSDRGYDLVTGCSVFMYPYESSAHLCVRYVDDYGHLPGEFRLPEEAVASWEWRERVRVPDGYLRATQNQDRDDWALIRLQYLCRISDQTSRFSHQVGFDCGVLSVNPSKLYGFPPGFVGLPEREIAALA